MTTIARLTSRCDIFPIFDNICQQIKSNGNNRIAVKGGPPLETIKNPKHRNHGKCRHKIGVPQIAVKHARFAQVSEVEQNDPRVNQKQRAEGIKKGEGEIRATLDAQHDAIFA